MTWTNNPEIRQGHQKWNPCIGTALQCASRQFHHMGKVNKIGMPLIQYLFEKTLGEFVIVFCLEGMRCHTEIVFNTIMVSSLVLASNDTVIFRSSRRRLGITDDGDLVAPVLKPPGNALRVYFSATHTLG